MKKFLSLFVISIMLTASVIPVYAANDTVKIKVDGKELSDAQAILKDGSTLLPVRSVGTALGSDVLWDAATQTVILEKDNTTVVAPVGEKFMIVNDEVMDITVPAQIIDGRTYVPLRTLGDVLDCDITWISSTKTVEITSKNTTKNRDLFADDTTVSSLEAVYIAVGETVPVPSDGNNWINWSNNKIISCEWSYFNGEEVVMMKGLKKGNCTVKLYVSDSQKGTIQGDYTEFKVYVVDEDSAKYQEQKAKRIAAGYDIEDSQASLIAEENALKESLGLKLINIYEKNYINKNGVLIIPIESKKELTGSLYLTVNSNADLEIVLDEYDGKPAIFIKGKKLESTNVILRYYYGTEKLDFYINEQPYEPTLLKERETICLISGKKTAAWEFKVNVVNETNSNFKQQAKERLENGISYDLYLNGEA